MSSARGAPIVVKADGLAAGKGVVVAATVGRSLRRDRRDAGRQRDGRGRRPGRHRGVPRRRGGELHRDGRRRHVLPLASSQDHKRLRDGDGAQHRRHGRVFAGAGGHADDARAHHARGHPADRRRHGRRRHALHRIPLCGRDDRRGGHAEGPRIQLPAGRSRNAADHGAPASPIWSNCSSTRVNGTLDRAEAEWDRRAALGVVLAAPGIPKRRARATRSPASSASPRLRIRTSRVPRRHRARGRRAVVVSGGRVLCVTALGDSVRQAQRAAYAADRRDPFRRHAVPQRHRLPRAGAAQGLTPRAPAPHRPAACAAVGFARRHNRRDRAIMPVRSPRRRPYGHQRPRHYFLALQERIVAALEARRRRGLSPRRAGSGPKAAAASRA